jgi:hypothetical protein
MFIPLQAEEIAVMTGAKISLVINKNGDTDKQYEFDSPSSMRPAIVQQRHAQIQKGTSQINKSHDATQVLNTPSKRPLSVATPATTPTPATTSTPARATSTTPAPATTPTSEPTPGPSHARPIVGMPGKRKSTLRKPPAKKAKNKCEKCGIIYDTKEDKAAIRKFGTNNQWEVSREIQNRLADCRSL